MIINKWKEGSPVRFGINYRCSDVSTFEIGIKIPLWIYYTNNYYDFETSRTLSGKAIPSILFYIRRRSNKFINEVCVPKDEVFWYQSFWERLKYRWIFDCNFYTKLKERRVAFKKDTEFNPSFGPTKITELPNFGKYNK